MACVGTGAFELDFGAASTLPNSIALPLTFDTLLAESPEAALAVEADGMDGADEAAEGSGGLENENPVKAFFGAGASTSFAARFVPVASSPDFVVPNPKGGVVDGTAGFETVDVGAAAD